MQSTSTKRIVLAVSALLFGLAAFWYWSPLLALRQLQAAAQSMDGPAFNERVDYPRLRESVKSAILSKRAAPAGDEGMVASVGRAFGEALASRLIDGLVQPEIVMRMMKHGKFNTGAEHGDAEPHADLDKKDWFSAREGTDTFIAYVGNKDETKEQRLGLVMERSGFATWRLVGLRMPQTATSDQAGAVQAKQ